MAFADSVRAAQQFWATTVGQMPAPDEHMLTNIRRASIVQQAVGVDELVRRLSRAEVDGTASIGRFGPVKFIPTLAELAGGKLADDGRRVGARAAVELAVARGYVFTASMEDVSEQEPAPPATRTTREIWDVWAPGLNSGVDERVNVPADLLAFSRGVGGAEFRRDAVELGLGRFGRKARLAVAGAFYTQAGVLLRAVHVHPEALMADPINPWKFDEMAP